MNIIKRYCFILLALAVVTASLPFAGIMYAEAAESPGVEHVYIASDSSAVVGATLSVYADYIGGASEDNCSYRWFSSKLEEIKATDQSGAKQLSSYSKTYTLTEAEVDRYIFCVITPSGGHPKISIPYGKIVSSGTGAATIDAASLRIGANDTRIGSTLWAHYTYQNPAGESESGTEIVWQRADSYQGTYTDIPGATGSSYVIKPEDYGKFISFKVTLSGGSAYEMNNRIYCTPENMLTYSYAEGTDNRYALMAPQIFAATDFIADNEGNMTWSNGDTPNFYTIDAGKRIQWDKLVFFAKQMDKLTKLEVSDDGSTFADLNIDEYSFNSDTLVEYKLNELASGRYIRATFHKTSNSTLKEIQAYLMPESFSELLGVNMEGVIYNRDEKTVTSIPQNTTAGQLKAALVTATSDPNVKILDYNGAEIADSDVVVSGYTLISISQNGKTSAEYRLSNEADFPNIIVKDISVIADATLGVRVDSTLNGDYTLAALNGDTADDSNTTYQWYFSADENGEFTAVSGATQKTYTPTASDLGGYLKFEVIPFVGAMRRSAAVGPVRRAISLVPTAPECESISVRAETDKLYAGDVLHGEYVYFDINADEEDTEKTEKQWFRITEDGVRTAIDGAVNDTYVLTEADEKLKIAFGVKPHAVMEPQPEDFSYGEAVYVTKEPAREDCEELTLGVDLNRVTSNLILPIKGSSGSDITWASSDSKVIGTDGVVKRQTLEACVTLTATVKHPERALSLNKVFDVKVAALPSGGGSSSGGGGGGMRYTVPVTPVHVIDNQENKNDNNGEPQYELSDLRENDWSYPFVIDLMNKGVLSKPEDGLFRPKSPLTREESVKMLVELFGMSDTSAECDFADVAEGEWFYPYIAAAASKGLVNGFGDGSFGTGKNITRQDFAVMTYNFLRAAGSLQETNEESKSFTDGETISDYALTAVSYLAEIGSIGGTPEGAFLPNNDIKREEAAKILSCLSN